MPMDAAAFSAFEARGWERIGAGYETFIGRVTRRTTVPLLDAAQVRPGRRVLDLATGPGHVAAEAAQRGAVVTGADIASSMLALARGHYPELTFTQADAEALPFEAGCFDAVLANFLLVHVARPELVAAEAARVLAPGGYAAFTTWDVPQRCRLVGVLVEAMERAQAPPAAGVPAGPPFFRFAEPQAAYDLLTAAGFSSVQVGTIAFDHPVTDAEQLWQGLLTGTVRNGAVLLAQPPETLERIRAEFERNLEPYRRADHLQVPVSVRLVSGRKP